ncbi:TetR/AcrR family transcriptional regulator [Rhodococcus maanshanensis]|uniref:DNA-binding transcriptional regulator YbjK n=1 Tax=Rhodococcus maanshanensis TaxID=183556 RepID=A0A1H7RJE5_9NOCA|nr:TetR family transcriptional regulator C-terminal domain-containing protein [Rhodococcus maanshanensis]SEL60235.1 DNA-binding transcriptional regulator YbjK [Rhodococcus maanshanensis]
MVRTADHDQRRAQIADAVLRVAGDDGLDAATVAKVAAQAGFSVGLIQHYFATKDLLIGAAYAECLGRLDRRIVEIVDHGERHGHSIRQMVIAGLGELLPLDEARRTECEIRTEFLARAIRSTALREVAASTSHDLRNRLARVIANGKACGEVDADTDEHLAAFELLATVQGLATAHLLSGESAPGHAVLERSLARVFPGRCRHHDPR